jgi:hypothetical protein
MPLLPPLVSPEELRDALDDERVRVFDATVFLRRPADGGPHTVESGHETARDSRRLILVQVPLVIFASSKSWPKGEEAAGAGT